MTTLTLTRWRGLKTLVQDVVENASRKVEEVHKATARRPFGVLERIPLVAVPARVVHLIHDASVSGVHCCIRLVNRVTGATLDVALDVLERRGADHSSAAPPDARLTGGRAPGGAGTAPRGRSPRRARA